MASSLVFNFLAGIFFLVIITFLGYYPQQEDFSYLLPGFMAAFGIYYFCCKKLVTRQSLPFWLGVAVVARFVLLFSVPNLSDDVYRFIWDGRLLNQGINPFEQLPGYYLLAGNEVSGITQSLFDQLNSPEYFTVYPPVCQVIFAVSTWLFPNSILGTIIAMKSFFLIFEMGTLFFGVRLLDHFKLDRKRILWYALNPLIILELTGNLHFEALMVFFLTAAIYCYVKSGMVLSLGLPHLDPKACLDDQVRQGSPARKHTTAPHEPPYSEGGLITGHRLKYLLISGVAMGFAIATKLLPLMFLPFFIKRLGWKKAVIYFGVIGVTVMALFAPLFSSVFLNNIGSSIGLYFQRFEFNGSIYYLLRWLGQQLSGYNQIRILGPALGLIIFIGIIYRAFKERDLSTLQLIRQMLFALTLFLFCTTTVMPWYLSGLILFSVFTGHRYPLVWSFMILGTYVNYRNPVFVEELWVVGVEYAVVAFFVWREIFD